MGVIRKRVDDYLYNSKGEEVEGAEKVTISIPAVAFGGIRPRKHDLDMVPRGMKAHDKERARVEEQTRQLWAPYLKNIGFDPTKHASKNDEGDDLDEDNFDKADAPDEADEDTVDDAIDDSDRDDSESAADSEDDPDDDENASASESATSDYGQQATHY